MRRLREELGITGLVLHPAGHIVYRADVGGGLVEHEEVDIFLAEASLDLAMVLNPDEVSDTRWVGLAELTAQARHWPDRFTPWLRIYLEQHQDSIFGTAHV